MIKGILFDFDGVIVDTESKKFEDIRKILVKHGLILKSSDFQSFIGKKTDFFLRKKFPSLSEEALQQIVKERRYLQFRNLQRYELIYGIKALLKYLKLKKYILALVTGSKKDFVNKLLKVNRISEYFKLIITGEEFKSSKPNPECYFKVCSDFPNLKKIGFEDSLMGIHALSLVPCIKSVFINSTDYYYYDYIIKNYDLLLIINNYMFSSKIV